MTPSRNREEHLVAPREDRLTTEVDSFDFDIDFPSDAIEDLQRRLDAVRWPDWGFDTGWERGTDRRTLRDLVR